MQHGRLKGEILDWGGCLFRISIRWLPIQTVILNQDRGTVQANCYTASWLCFPNLLEAVLAQPDHHFYKTSVQGFQISNSFP